MVVTGDEGYMRIEHCLPGTYSSIAPLLTRFCSDHRAAAGWKRDDDGGKKPIDHLCMILVANVTSAIPKHRHKTGGEHLLPKQSYPACLHMRGNDSASMGQPGPTHQDRKSNDTKHESFYSFGL
jgi:hypothetical protein